MTATEILEFSFNKDNLQKAQEIISHYPDGKQRSAVLPLLNLAQRQIGGWLPQIAIEYVAKFLDLPFIRVYEVATFYTMFNLKPVGKYHIQICGTTPCWLRGSDEITKVCHNELGIGLKEVTPDKQFSLVEVECLGACVNAPVVQINDDYFEDLTPELMTELLNKLKAGKAVCHGSQIGRTGAEPKKQ